MFLPKGVQNLTARSADNPLQGGTLQWDKQAEGVPIEGSRACSVWPIDDTITVTANDAEICVTGTQYALIDANFDNTSNDHMSIESDAADDEKDGEAGIGSFVEAPRRKVGACTTPSTGHVKNVWAADYQNACVPNKNRFGQPGLTMRSTYLQVGDARWKFEPAPEAPTTTTPEAAPAAASTTHASK